jgi:beta-lactam-binding protein with PASTA domain
VPDVGGETLANAEQLILEAGLVPASSESGKLVTSKLVTSKLVTSQSPPPGVNVVVGSTVTIVLQKGPLQ